MEDKSCLTQDLQPPTKIRPESAMIAKHEIPDPDEGNSGKSRAPRRVAEPISRDKPESSCISKPVRRPPPPPSKRGVHDFFSRDVKEGFPRKDQLVGDSPILNPKMKTGKTVSRLQFFEKASVV